VYVESASGNAMFSQPATAEAPLSAAALRYLELGDEAFGAGRYADAVHFYSRSIEFEPDRGMLHLVLADALFATGDYHYCAHSIRKALELEPTLVAAPVDKHLFYAVPAEFDKQLAVLELYLADYKTDVDARLVLGLNYLFGERPQAAVTLLENGPNASAAFGGEAATLILESAKEHQYGDQLPPGATWE
jgi:tetratricopeptide (TPR) repeat protein